MEKIGMWISLIVALAMAATFPAAAYGADALISQQETTPSAFTDTAGTWCGLYVQTCYEAGLMEGKSTRRFDPSGTLTNAQVTVICARLLNRLQDGDGILPQAQNGAAWYQPAYDLLMSGGVLAEPDDNQSSLPLCHGRLILRLTGTVLSHSSAGRCLPRT